MKNKLYELLTRPSAVIFVIITATILAQADRNYGYFFGIFVVLFLLYKGGYKWSDFGLGQALTTKTVIRSLYITALMYGFVDILIQPFLENYFGEIDLSSIEDIRGDFGNYLILVIIMWIFAAFGEELLFSGYYMKRIAELFGNSDRAWFFTAIAIGIYFGASHFYQGPAGMIAVGLTGVISSLLYARNRDNLALIILVHGFYDLLGITLIYLNQDRIFFDLVQAQFFAS